jgi:magnesium chelatase subunit D
MGEAAEANEVTKTTVMLAREWLKDVTISKEQVKYIVMEVIHGGCQGHTAELAAVTVAKALASLEGRDRVDVDDLKEASARVDAAKA